MVDAKDESGKTQRWKLELDNRHELVDGVTSDTLKPGDRLVVTGSPSRTEPHSLYTRKLERLADSFLYEQIGSSPRIRKPSR